MIAKCVERPLNKIVLQTLLSFSIYRTMVLEPAEPFCCLGMSLREIQIIIFFKINNFFVVFLQKKHIAKNWK